MIDNFLNKINTNWENWIKREILNPLENPERVGKESMKASKQKQTDLFFFCF